MRVLPLTKTNRNHKSIFTILIRLASEGVLRPILQKKTECSKNLVLILKTLAGKIVY